MPALQAWHCCRIVTPDRSAGGTPGGRAERLAERVRAASYGAVLVIAALGRHERGRRRTRLFRRARVRRGRGHVDRSPLRRSAGTRGDRTEPLRRAELRDVMVDGSPILLATVLPAIVLIIGRGELMSAEVTHTLCDRRGLRTVGRNLRVRRARRAAAWSRRMDRRRRHRVGRDGRRDRGRGPRPLTANWFSRVGRCAAAAGRLRRGCSGARPPVMPLGDVVRFARGEHQVGS